MRKFIQSLAFLMMPLLFPSMLAAETVRYVSDQLEITMRTGQGVQYSIRKMLRSGTEVVVVETDPTGYSKVRTSDGVEGWVLSRYLANQPVARDRLAEKAQTIATLELEIAGYKEELASLSAQHSDVDDQNLGLRETAQRLSKELDELRRTASNAIALDNENRQLKEKLQEMDYQIQAAQMEVNALRDSSAKSWFLIGAAVLFAGLLLGLIMPSLRVRKKSSWGSL
ncbi:hypothetical protein MPL1_01139 [Methylophaga lonarensis MPL]|uniref:SH3b domain-containing protein n=2 Tax=Methylophaga lonarensis TaxID=999151 RepID=M7NZB0_9GAMM|nr:hypothetical protein MPL1_01139 [Methylophaga lonarensis MPL]